MSDSPKESFPLTYEGEEVGKAWFENEDGFLTIEFELNEGVVIPDGAADVISLNMEPEDMSASLFSAGETEESYTAQDIREVHTSYSETDNVIYPPYDN